MSLAENLGRIYARSGDHPDAASVAGRACEIVDLLDVPVAAWVDLAGRAVEANAFFAPDWARAVARHAAGKSGAQALLAWDGPARSRLIGLLPVVSAWRAFKIPVPALVAWQAYAPVTTPLLDRDSVDDAARELLAAAHRAGALALLLPMVAHEGSAAAALRRASAALGNSYLFNAHERARLDATQSADAAVEALGAKKLKELRRQRNRLADDGAVSFEFVADPAKAQDLLEDFLRLEAQGWKGARGTALGQNAGDAQFVREAVPAMIARGAAQLTVLSRAGKTLAAGIALRHLRRGYFFKIAHDETLAKTSPGVQLTLDMTRGFCDDPALDDVDSIAVSGHPMIDHVWRARLAIGDLLLPVRRDPIPFNAIAAAIAARNALREAAKRGVHFVRSLKGKHA